MILVDKLGKIIEVSNKIKSLVCLEEVNGELYVESDYFKDSFEEDINPIGFNLVVINPNSIFLKKLEIKLNVMYMSFVFNIIDKDTFNNFFIDEYTKIS